MKKINLFIVGLVGMFAFAVSASAADSISLSCTKTNISIGESSNCTVTLNTEQPVMATSVTFSTSETLDISDVVANTSGGWSASSSSVAGTYAFNHVAPGASGKNDLFSFDITLNEKAKNLGVNDDCGKICISAATIDGGSLTGITEGPGYCFTPNLVEKNECVGEDCNPKTGAFANYAAILGVAAVAIGAIVIARRSSKFYRV